MSKRIFIFLIIFLIVFAFLIFNFRKSKIVKAASTVGTSIAYRAIYLSCQYKSFYANGRFWVFYSDGTNMVYNTSTDGSTWSAPIIARTGITEGRFFSVWFDGTFLHYAFAPSSGVPNTNLSYRRGTPNSNGTITWSAAEQTVKTSNEKTYLPFVSVDSSGYVWIGYMEKAGTDSYPFVIKSSNNDGTWGTITPSYQLSTISADWLVSIIPLTGGKMLAVYSSTLSPVKARRWTGSVWGMEKATVSPTRSSGSYSVVAEGDDTHLLMNTGSAILYTKYSYVSDAWGPEATVQTSALAGAIGWPVLSRNTVNNDLYAFWADYPTADHIYYKKNVAGTWDTNPTDWITETSINNVTTGFYQDYGSKIGLVYTTGSSSPYNVRFEYLSLPPIVITLPATDITSSQATLNGSIDATGGENASERGFDWGTGPYNAPGSPWTETGSFGTGNFSHQITELTPGTTYFFRAKARNSAGWDYGDELSFTTSPAFDFSLSVSPTSGTVSPGNQITTTITATLISGTTQIVSFSASGLPAGANASFNPGNCNPTCTSTMTISTAATTPIGVFPITITGQDGGLTRTTTYTLAVAGLPVGATFLKVIGGSSGDSGDSVTQTTDGGYIVAGYTASYGAGNSDILLSKFDSQGNLSWAKAIGGTGDDSGESVIQTTDGGYIVVGETYSYGAGNGDVFLLKFDSIGNLSWAKTIGRDKEDRGYSVAKTTDGGYIVAGLTYNWGAGLTDVLVMKFDSTGNLSWLRAIGGTNYEFGLSVAQATDGGYIGTGWTMSYGAGGDDILVFKLHSNGDFSWAKTIGGSGNDYSYSVAQATEGYIVAGDTNSYGAGNIDFLLLKLAPTSEFSWAKTIGGSGNDRISKVGWTTDGGYIVSGWTDSWGAGALDTLLLKTDSDGNISNCAPITAVSPTVTTITPGFVSPPPSPTITSPSPTITSPSPIITTFSPNIITQCYVPAISNVSLWAWSENIGWISFNCTDTNSCAISPYGVNIDETTGDFSGYAWSENIGWIKFGEPLKIITENYPTCPSTTCPDGSPSYSARLDSATGKVTGWARACAGTVNGDCNSATRTDGWDGWILLGPIVKNNTDYGVKIDSCISPAPFRNWAWGSEVVGWISFNALNTGSSIDYKVVTTLTVNQKPSVQSGSTIVTGESYCPASPIGQVSIQWTYLDDCDNQAHYNLQVATDSGFTNIILNYDTEALGLPPQGIVPGGTGTSAIRVVPSPTPEEPEIQYTGAQETRYWQVRVKAATGNLDWSNFEEGPSFIIPSHAWPRCDFSWSPQQPSVDEIVSFTDQSTCYDTDGSCDSWSWTFPADWQFEVGSSATSTDPVGKFTTSGGKTVTLTVTDSDGFICSDSKSLNITLPLPEWKEISPF